MSGRQESGSSQRASWRAQARRRLGPTRRTLPALRLRDVVYYGRLRLVRSNALGLCAPTELYSAPPPLSTDPSATCEYTTTFFTFLKAMATRQAQRPASDGSRTITVEDNQPREEGQTDEEPSTVGTLRLRGVARHRQRVVWREDVVDNEGAGKKKSKSE